MAAPTFGTPTQAYNPLGNVNFGYQGTLDTSSDPNNPPDLTTGSTTPSGGFLQGAGKFLQTPGGAAAINAVGGGLSALGQYQTQQQQMGQNALQFAATQAANNYWNQQNLNLNRANAVAQNNPLGAQQAFAQKQALLNAILPNLRNFHSQPGDAAVASAMGGSRGGVMNALGPNGLDPNMVSAMFGPNATMASLVQNQQQLNNIDPKAPSMNLNSMYGASANGAMSQIQQWAQQAQSMDASQKAQFEQQLNGYINQMVQQEQNSGGFWHTFAKIAGVVGAVAATVMTAGGASPLLAGAIGAGAGAAGAWGNNSNPLMGAIVGGGTAYAGAKAKGNG